MGGVAGGEVEVGDGDELRGRWRWMRGDAGGDDEVSDTGARG